jgi:hypothetical protein
LGTRLNLRDAYVAPAFIGDRRCCKSLFLPPVEELEKLFSQASGIAVALSAMIGNATLLVHGFERKIGCARRRDVGRESRYDERCDSVRCTLRGPPTRAAVSTLRIDGADDVMEFVNGLLTIISAVGTGQINEPQPRRVSAHRPFVPTRMATTPSKEPAVPAAAILSLRGAPSFGRRDGV